jgi:hypothetical protein
MLATAAARLASSTTGPAAAVASSLASLPRWATLDPSNLGSDLVPHAVLNLVNGNWVGSETNIVVPNPMDHGRIKRILILQYLIHFLAKSLI